MRAVARICAPLAVLAMAGCSGGSSTPATSGASSTPASASPTASPLASETVTPAVPASPTSTPSLSPSASPSAAALAGCPTSSLKLSTGRGGAAAGTYYLPLVFTNVATTACSLRGFPGVSFVDANGSQIGPSAQRAAGQRPHDVVLNPGAKAHATLAIPNNEMFSQSDCQPKHAAGIRAYPPNQTAPLAVHFKSTVCTTPAGRASIESVRPGTHD